LCIANALVLNFLPVSLAPLSGWFASALLVLIAVIISFRLFHSFDLSLHNVRLFVSFGFFFFLVLAVERGWQLSGISSLALGLILLPVELSLIRMLVFHVLVVICILKVWHSKCFLFLGFCGCGLSKWWVKTKAWYLVLSPWLF